MSGQLNVIDKIVAATVKANVEAMNNPPATREMLSLDPAV
jgi:hypothetical protein